ncbi:MAG TPA: chloride channel protein [Myxococcales bacterium]|nr:chloride channel protein [Myxococcales bacterium]
MEPTPGGDGHGSLAGRLARLFGRAREPLRHPLSRVAWERALFLAVAAVIGIYAGIAAGLFSQSIRFTQILFFRGDEVAAVLFGSQRAVWAAAFRSQLAHAHWHVEFAVAAVLALALAAAAEALAARKPSMPRFELHRVRPVALAGALGLALYYPLVFLHAFNGTFHQPGGGLFAIAVHAPLWVRVLAPACGALAAGLLVRYVSPESGGHGVVEVIEAIHVRGRELRGRIAVWKSLAAGLVIGSGGSAGKEGPVVHLGGAVAASLGRFLALPRREAAVLLACGAGAGIAASFQAPLAGAMFALEIVLADFSVSRFAPIVLACVTATTTSRALLGGSAELQPVSWTLQHSGEIAVYLLLGVAAGGAGMLYIRAVHAAEEMFSGRAGGRFAAGLAQLRPEWRAAIGGFAVGLFGLIAPRILGTGIETMNAALAGELAFGALALTFVMKLAGTAATLGSGSPGGSFFPAVFLGAMFGGAFGRGVHFVLPSLTSAPGAYAAVGMGALVAGATAAPLTGVMMMFELTSSYQIVLPLLVACGSAAAVVNGVLGGSIYTLGARRRGIAPRIEEPLRNLSVAQAFEETPVVTAETTGTELTDALDGGHEFLPVVDVRGFAVGVLAVAAARESFPVEGRPTAAELANKENLVLLMRDDDLQHALHRLSDARAALAVVVEDPAAPRPLGIVTREGILDAWHRANR